MTNTADKGAKAPSFFLAPPACDSRGRFFGKIYNSAIFSCETLYILTIDFCPIVWYNGIIKEGDTSNLEAFIMYTYLNNPNYTYTYAVIDRTTLEVYTYSCDSQSVALKSIYRRFDSIIRNCSNHNYPCHLLLVNARTDEVVIEYIS